MIATHDDFEGFRASLLAAGFDGSDADTAERVITYADPKLGRVHLLLVPDHDEDPDAEYCVTRFYVVRGDYAASPDVDGTHQECLDYIAHFLALR